MDNLDSLWELQEVRKDYLSLKKREKKANASKEVKTLEERLQTVQEKNQFNNFKISGIEKDLKTKNLDLQALESKKESIQKELYNGKAKPKELANLQIQLEYTETEFATTEEKLLQLTEELAQIQASAGTLLRETEDIELQLGALKANLEVELQEIHGEMEEVKNVHAKMLKGIDKQCLKLYNRKFKQHSVTTLAKVSGGICTGCNLHIPRYIMADVKKRDVLVGCESCGRILYYTGSSE